MGGRDSGKAKYHFRLVRSYAGKRRFRLKKRLKEESLLAKIINISRGGRWS